MSRKLIGETVRSNNSERQMGYKIWNGIR